MSVFASDNERITYAKIAGAVARHTDLSALTGRERDSVLAELAEISSGHTGLLAMYAGLTVGLHEGDADEARYLRAAQLCIDAGADTRLIRSWLAEGRRRARQIGATDRSR